MMIQMDEWSRSICPCRRKQLLTYVMIVSMGVVEEIGIGARLLEANEVVSKGCGVARASRMACD